MHSRGHRPRKPAHSLHPRAAWLSYLAKMKMVTIHAAKTNLSRLIAQACAGEEIVIARGDQPVARLVPIAKVSPHRRFGAMKGRARVSKAFFEPLPPDELSAWEGGG